MDIILGGIWWQIPDTRPSRVARWIRPCWIETEEFDNAFPVFVRRSALVLFPFLDGSVSDSKSKQISQLRHGQLHVDPLFAKMFSQGLGCGWAVA